MKTILFSRKCIISFLFIVLGINCFSQNATLIILKNGVKISPEDMSAKKGDKIVVQILNADSKLKYKISNLNLEVRTIQYQQIKSMEQAKKYHKNITLSSDFEKSPKLEIEVKTYASKFVSRLLLKLLLVEQYKDNETTTVNWITYGKEYVFWYYN